MSPLSRPSVPALVRFGIQVLFFVFLPTLFSAAFNGVKYIVGRIAGAEPIDSNPFLTYLIILVLFTFVFGRFFCGFACAFGSLGDWLYALSSFLQEKAGKRIRLPDKVIRVLSGGKFVVLAVVVLTSYLGVYGKVAVIDPWEIFGAFRYGNFLLAGRILMAISFAMILVGMLLVERFFCMFLCPLGAVFALLPMLPFTTFGRKREACIPGCALCTRLCPAAIPLGEDARTTSACFQCGRCAVRCPRKNIRPGIRKLTGTEIPWTAAKAALLFTVFYFLV